jgi:hypothetical protein
VDGSGWHIWGDGFIPRMNRRSRKGIMQAIAPSDLFTYETPSIQSIIVDARLASEDPDIGAELRDRDITMIVDSQAWRYSDSRTWESAWNSVSYLPSTPFNARRNWVYEYVFKDLSAQFKAGGRCLLLPGWFPSLETTELAREVAAWTLEAFEEFRRKVALIPAIAWLPARPGFLNASLASAEVYAASGTVHAVYVQHYRINGLLDPLDRLKRTAKLMLEVQHLGLPVIAGYLGSIGLTIRAIGVSAADCGPCEGQHFDFTDAIRTALPRREDTSSELRLPVRMWLDEVGQTVTGRQMAAIRRDRVAYAEILCRRPCHRFRLGRDTVALAAHHSLLSLCETATRQSRIPASMRPDNARRLLTAMKTRIGVMDAALGADNQRLLRQEHLDVQLALLADADSLHGVA